MSVFSKILQSTSKNISKAIYKEQRGIYNVTYNGKNATTICKDLEKIDEVITYTKGNRNKSARRIHLEHSLDSSQQGYVTPDEVANLGTNIRAYINKHGQAFSDTNKARVYEWEKGGVRFRAVVNDISNNASSGNSLLPCASEEIITFYSDRNLQNKMIFKNPAQDSTHPLTSSAVGGGINKPARESTAQESSKKESQKLNSNALIKQNLPPMMRE